MKKTTIPSYILRTKWILILLIAVTLVIFGRTVKTPSLSKTAIVLGAGIDYSEEDSLFTVTTQTVYVASSAGENSGSNMYLTYTDTGKTVAAALDGISRKMGLNISLSHCNVLFLSKNTFSLDLLQLLAPLKGMYSLPEQSIVVTGELPPKEMLALRLGTTTSAPFFLQSTLVNQEGSDGMIRTTAKDLLARALSRSKANAIPYMKVKKLESPPLTQETEIKDSYEFEISQAMVFNDKNSFIITDELAEVLALYLSDEVTGTLNYTSENGESFEFRILDNKVDLKTDGRRVFVEMELPVDLLDVQFVNENYVLSGADPIVREAAEKLSKQLEEDLNELYRISLELDIDFLNLQAKVYQSEGYKLEEDCLSTISFESKINLKVREAA